MARPTTRYRYFNIKVENSPEKIYKRTLIIELVSNDPIVRTNF